MRLLLLPLFLSTTTLIPLSESASDAFWMTVEVLRVDWRDGCLTTAGCSQPRFKVLADMLPINEKMSISWPVSEHFVQDSARPFVTHWTQASPDELTVSCQVVGTDPLYGFPRVCDQTASVRIFQQQVLNAYERMRSRRGFAAETATPEEDNEQRKHIIEVRGKCFNATMSVQKHTERCPWCPHPDEMTLIQQEVPEESPSPLFAHFSTSSLMLLLILVTAIAVLSVAAFACLLVCYFRQKKRLYKQVCKPRFHPYKPQNGGALVRNDEENRYDMPWEQTRPLTYWLSSSSTSGKGATSECTTTTSPLDSASSLPYAYRLPPPSMPPPTVIVPSTRLYHTISPNASMMHHDDSGLESV